MHGNKFRLFLVVSCLVTVHLKAQNGNSGSPYSVYGFGDRYGTELAQFEAMGGASNAFQSPIQVSQSNPASFAHLRITNYNFGINGAFLRLQNANQDLDKTRYNLAYFGLAFPVGRKAGMGFGLQPYSVVDYDVEVTNDDASIPYSERYEGFGGLNRVYLAGAWKPFKYASDSNAFRNLSLGAEVDFFFGNMNNRQFIAFPDSAETHNLRISRDDHLYGLAYKFGAQYKKVIRTTIQIDSLGTTEDVDHQLYFGINLQSEAKLSGSRISLSERYTLGQSGIAFIRDTTRIETQESSGSLRSILPASIGLGFGYSRREHLYLAADWTYQPWSRSRSFGEDQGLVDAWNLGVGGYYQPMSLDKYKAGDVYWSIVKYKLGFKYGSGYLKLQEQNISNLGITFGLSLPVRGASTAVERFSSLNLAVELGQRGTIESNLIKEKYVNFVVGFSLLDRWFIKRRYD